MLREGTWWTRSKKDPRFNMNGRGIVGMFALPEDAKVAIDKKCAELGLAEPPDDLEFEYMKD